MPHIQHINVVRSRNVERLEIDLTEPPTPAKPPHLILTGPNGSGKTSLLTAMSNAEIPRGGNAVKYTNAALGARLFIRWDEDPPPASDLITSHFGAFRQVPYPNVSGPTALDLAQYVGERTHEFGNHFLQYLVNKRTEQAFAQVDGDVSAVEEIERWFIALVDRLRTLLDDEHLTISFDRARFTFLVHTAGSAVTFNELADGHRASLAILADLLIHREAIRHATGTVVEPYGVAFIDEPETHLHIRLQEVLLPFLCHLFPNVQFIAATHSPAVLTSIPNALIVDLSSRTTEWSDNLQGIRYGTLMTGHFGVPTEYDLATSVALERLRTLRDTQSRTPAEDEEFRSLAQDLASKSHTLAMQVLLELDPPVDGSA